MKTYAIINQKGGVGKSTTAAVLMAGLTQRGYRVLGVDLDAQYNLSIILDADTQGLTTRDVLMGDATAREAIQHTASGDIIPASDSLTGADRYIVGVDQSYRLAEALAPVKSDYDYIVLDAPPTLGVLTINALTAADSAIVPAQADLLSLRGIDELAKTIRSVRKYSNRDLVVEGILLTRHSDRTVLGRELAEVIADRAKLLDTRVFGSTIREAVAIKESQVSQIDLFRYAPNANVTQDYQDFISELIKGDIDHE